MINLDARHLMMIEPVATKAEPAVQDEYTAAAKYLAQRTTNGAMYKGWHDCACGEASGCRDLKIGGRVTNSLLVHYVEHHRSEVPETELQKIERLAPRFFGESKSM